MASRYEKGRHDDRHADDPDEQWLRVPALPVEVRDGERQADPDHDEREHDGEPDVERDVVHGERILSGCSRPHRIRA